MFKIFYYKKKRSCVAVILIFLLIEFNVLAIILQMRRDALQFPDFIRSMTFFQVNI